MLQSVREQTTKLRAVQTPRTSPVCGRKGYRGLEFEADLRRIRWPRCGGVHEVRQRPKLGILHILQGKVVTRVTQMTGHTVGAGPGQAEVVAGEKHVELVSQVSFGLLTHGRQRPEQKPAAAILGSRRHGIHEQAVKNPEGMLARTTPAQIPDGAAQPSPTERFEHDQVRGRLHGVENTATPARARHTAPFACAGDESQAAPKRHSFRRMSVSEKTVCCEELAHKTVSEQTETSPAQCLAAFTVTSGAI
jgi:hypothetical protein